VEKQEVAMGRKVFIALAVTTAVSALGVVSAAAGKDDVGDRGEVGGAVVPCSLDGVNPAFHPHIFGNPAVAKSYGFEKSRDGTWHVQVNCSSSLRENQKR
jgi:hypothetical protein